MTLLTKQDLLNREVQISKVTFDNGEFVYVREMSGRDRSKLESSMLKFKDGADISVTGENTGMTMDTTNLKAKYACLCLCDEKGKLIFAFEDADKFGGAISARELDHIIEVADGLNNFMSKGKEDLVKN